MRLATEHCVDEEIHRWLARREKRRQRHVCSSPKADILLQYLQMERSAA
jgi:hypothetical protein